MISVEELAECCQLTRSGAGYIGTCPACGYKGALSVGLGDDDKVLIHCHVGCSFRDVERALGTPVGCEVPGNRALPVRRNRSSSSSVCNAHRRLLTGAVSAAGTLASRYLVARGISMVPPPDIRFLARHKHSPSQYDFPVMVGVVRDVTGCVTGIHRTYLAWSGKGKADVKPAKMTLGRIGSGGVRLHRSGIDLSELAISEGIETGLSVAEATKLPVWAALSAGGIERLVLPPLPLANRIVIFADRDGHGRGQRAADAAAERFIAEGRRVRIVLPPKVDTDFNDIMRGAA